MKQDLLFLIFLGLVATLSMAAQPAHSQILGNGATISPDAKIARADVRWMEKAIRGGIAEVEAGKLAAATGGSDDVRNFGKAMVEQHGKANDELNAIATRKGVLLPTQPDRAHMKVLEKLAALSGDKFDKEYMRSAGIKDHSNAAKLYQDGAGQLKDPDLKEYAGKTLIIIKRHAEMIRESSVVR